ncbi:dihydroxyacetone kinase family protein [Rubrobacter indicoceani]|uniref:dihydroxyacetone kinase family protein n=1 Tax=Rubrobacter indicoceani TaxID=2051957 RepID=UPI000E5B27C9|nr:dihydroxyacetone kinase family protein [Rubrobacter indicoceani]
MQRITNDPTSFKDEMIEGFVSAYGRYVKRVPNASGVMAAGSPKRGKVSVVIGGGSGHYPAFCGIVGAGLADGAVMGDIFASPSGEQVYRVTKALDGGAGVLYSYGNYSGDVMHFGMAELRCRREGMDVRTVVVTDDVASAPKGREEERRGIAGDFYVFKVAGAAATRGDDLDSVERLAVRANDATRTMGLAFGGCTLPGQAEPLFTVGAGKMEVGMGIHGEPGIDSSDMLPASGIAELLVERLLDDAPEGAGGRVAVIMNGLGTTKYEELFVIFRDVGRLLGEAGLEVHSPEVGEIVTSLDMAGCSLTLMWLDDELQELHDAPAETPAFSRGGAGLSNGNGTADFETIAPPDEAEDIEASTGETTPGGDAARDGLARALRAVSGAEQELGRLDAVAGDGDHGSGMVRGFRAAVAAADGYGGSAGAVLVRAGAAFSDAAGGASGALYGSAITALGQGLDADGTDAGGFHRAFRDALDAIKHLGGAEVGDKTMVDTLEPFVVAFGGAASGGASRAEAWRAALSAAEVGADSTSDMISALGRASKLGERSRGSRDPGATSMLYVLRAAGEAIPGGGS